MILGNIAFQALSLGVLGVFCWTVYSFRAQVAECLKSIVAIPRSHASHAEGAAAMYDGFTGVAMILGAISTGVAAVKVTAWLLASGTGTPGTIQWRIADLAGTAGIAGIPSWMAPTAAVAVAIACACVVLVEVFVLKAVGTLTLSREFAGDIVRTKKSWMAAVSILITPLVAVWTGVNPARDRIIAYLIVIVIIALILLFVIHTLRGFIKQKVSLLVWFLYLCTVELFPVAAVMLAVTKNL